MSVLVGNQAPDFSVKAVINDKVIENYTLSQFHGKKYVVLFFYPLDFTFVCPTELHEFQQHLAAFQKLHTEVLGVSTDSHFSHQAWLNTPKKEGGIQGVSYPLLSDFNKTIARDYDVLLPGGMALRGSFLIDKKGIVQAQNINNLDLGRSVPEMLRLVQALQYTEEHGEVCHATWQPGEKGMNATAAGVKQFFSR